MKIICELSHYTTRQACDIVEKHCMDSAFYFLVLKERFNMAGTEEIVRRLKVPKTFYVKSYTVWNPFSRVIGHFDGDTCYLNTRKMERPLQDIVETIFHECLGHGIGFSHNGNYVTQYNLKTWPFKGANMFVKYCKSIGAL